ncbi:hypothetical protein [Dyella silvatica]|uniref:hypothetical protein n=1 Tax=Dyella silvatica TaxID=2992128 RepID=UPI0022533F31|nr:hypothetical protein [Dyella silvatica]
MLRHIALSACLVAVGVLGSAGAARANVQPCSYCEQLVANCVASGQSQAHCQADYLGCFRLCTNDPPQAQATATLPVAPVATINPAIPRDQRLIAGLEGP